MPETHVVIDEIIKCIVKSNKPDNASKSIFIERCQI